VASFMEKTGTFTSAERLVQRLHPTFRSPSVKTDLEIFVVLAAMMGKPSMTYSGPEQVMTEIAGLVETYAGISYDRLAQGPIPWPCVDSEDPGKPVLYEGGFPKGKAQLAPAPNPAATAVDDLPFYLVSGILKFHSGSFSQWSPSLMEVCPDGLAEMHRNDLKALDLKEGDTVRLSTGDGASIQLNVSWSRRALQGTVIVAEHSSQVKLNTLLSWAKAVVKVRVEKV
jgi:predicted molibdopterin-dependent oxidoreductase YjgC